MEYNSRPIIYTSPPAPVSMTDAWYEIAHPDHFWVRRRFEVMDRLAGPLIRNGQCIAEIGCGNGLVQKSIEDHYGKAVAGFELNELSLKQNVSRLSQSYCYDIHQRAEEFNARFDVVLLFDVLEHIADEGAFLQSVKFHMIDS
jgi:2-polyprenyl-3-methyl-5-hydroxy-6-metoxy-1,4-benzoquinol methylase